MERTLYIAGPMSGLPEYNYPAFNYAAGELRVAGFEVENPADNTIESEDYHDWVVGRLRDGLGVAHHLRAGLAQLLRCDGVAVLEDWWLSGGARWEVTTAGILGLPVRSVDEWLRLADAEPAPVKPSLEDVAGAIWSTVVAEHERFGMSGPLTLGDWEEAYDNRSMADAVLALLPGRAEAEVKAEALEGMAKWFQIASRIGTGERDALAAQACVEAADRLRGESNG